MTPLEKAKAEEGHVNYCDECEQFQIVGNAAYCKADGKLIHPIKMMRGQGTGPAWNCKKRKPLTNYDCIVSKTPEELAELFANNDCGYCRIHDFCYAKGCAGNCENVWLDWLRQEASP